MNIDKIFEGFAELSMLVEKEDKRRKEEARLKRNAKARSRYAIKKVVGLLVTKKERERIKKGLRDEAEQAEIRAEYEMSKYCTCFLGHPPCPYCLSDHDEEEE